jgi:hypothetical protein
LDSASTSTITFVDGEIGEGMRILNNRLEQIVALNPWLEGFLEELRDGSIVLLHHENRQLQQLHDDDDGKCSKAKQKRRQNKQDSHS